MTDYAAMDDTELGFAHDGNVWRCRELSAVIADFSSPFSAVLHARADLLDAEDEYRASLAAVETRRDLFLETGAVLDAGAVKVVLDEE